MATLYLTEQGATLRKEHRRFVIESNGVALSQVHEFKVERVVIFGHVQLTTQAIGYLLARGIDAAFLNLQGQLKGRLAPLASKNVPLRLRQYDRARNPVFALETARAIVVGKIANCAAVLARHQRNHPETEFSAQTAQLAALSGTAGRRESLDSLRGVEGQAAAVYFQSFGRMLRRGFEFSKRTRRPPTDPVNSLLSFGYTLLYNEAIGALVSVGCDPYVGLYHGINYGRCSLALDLMEEFRHLTIDRLTLQLINLGVLGAEDFAPDEMGGIYLQPEARKRFLKEYERMMTGEFTHGRAAECTSFRRALHEQARKLAARFARDSAYAAFQGWR
jgi:CRISPR-associated protein Cas1